MTHTHPTRRWNPISLAIITLAWAVLQLGGLFSPGLLDDVDSIYIQVAREMLQRHDFVTPTIDGIRFFDKPPLMYWIAAASMKLFGVHDWAARLPLALGMLALLFAIYGLGIRLYAAISPPHAPDRAGFYAALALATSIGPYLYTRFYIPDILIALWMTLAVHLFLIALDRLDANPNEPVILSKASQPHRDAQSKDLPHTAPSHPVQPFSTSKPSPLTPMLVFGIVLALSVLTKGLIGLLFPVGFALLFLAFTHRLRDLTRLHIPLATLAFAAVAVPWHVLAALRNPAIAMPPGVGLPARAGWAWFYLYNEHVARFLGRRIPHDYGQVPIPLFWLLLFLWLIPWTAFLFPAILNAIRTLRSRPTANLRFDSDVDAPNTAHSSAPATTSSSRPQSAHFADVVERPALRNTKEPALTTILWATLILVFFTLSSRQEYYHLPALPALALLAAALLAAADRPQSTERRQSLRASFFFLVPLGALLFLVCGYFALTAKHPAPGADLFTALSSNPEMYNLSLGHIFDLTGTAMGFFRGPLLTVALSALALGPLSHLIRRRGHTLAANLITAAAMTGILLAAHTGLARFYPTLGSKELALQIEQVRQPTDLVLIDGELTAGSTLLFYTNAARVHLVNGRVNGPWFGSFWPDAPKIFEDDASLHRLWAGPQRIFLLTYNPTQRTTDLAPFAAVHALASSGGKTVLTNRQ